MPSRFMRRPTVRSALTLLVTVATVGIMTTSLRAYAVQAFVVPSASMTPTLQVGDRIVVDKLASTVRRGDIVVFHRAPGDRDLRYAILVKRVIGLPGETISQRGTTILIDGQPLAQPWLPAPTGICAQPSPPVATTTIPPGQYFVMGDCRGDSEDSRYWGTVPAADIIGKVTAVVWRDGHPWLHWF
jgi:signal peptidase I